MDKLTLEVGEYKVEIDLTESVSILDYIEKFGYALKGITFAEKTVDIALGFIEEDDDGYKRRIGKIGKYELYKRESPN